jgi:hypothetical protein
MNTRRPFVFQDWNEPLPFGRPLTAACGISAIWQRFRNEILLGLKSKLSAQIERALVGGVLKPDMGHDGKDGTDGAQIWGISDARRVSAMKEIAVPEFKAYMDATCFTQSSFHRNATSHTYG